MAAEESADIPAERNEAAPHITSQLARKDEHDRIVHRMHVRLDATAVRDQLLTQLNSTGSVKLERRMGAGLVHGTNVRGKLRAPQPLSQPGFLFRAHRQQAASVQPREHARERLDLSVSSGKRGAPDARSVGRRRRTGGRPHLRTPRADRQPIDRAGTRQQILGIARAIDDEKPLVAGRSLPRDGIRPSGARRSGIKPQGSFPPVDGGESSAGSGELLVQG